MLHFITNPEFFKLCKDDNLFNQLKNCYYVEHQESQGHHSDPEHIHCYIDQNGLTAETFRKRLNRLVLKYNLIKDYKRYSLCHVPSFEKWAAYVRHEPCELKCITSDNIDYEKIFNEMPVEKTNAAITDQTSKKRKAIEEMRETKKKIKLESAKSLLDMVREYRISHESDLKRVSPDVYLEFVQHNDFKHLQRFMDYIQFERVQWERNAIKQTESINWYQIATINHLIKVEEGSDEERFILEENNDYMENGKKIINHLLTENVIGFELMNMLVNNVFKRMHPKKNAIYIVGRKDTGKSIIQRVITNDLCTAFISEMGNASQFIFDDIIDKTCISLEECHVALHNADAFKQLFEGSNLQVNIKHQKSRPLDMRIPVVTTSNDKPWCDVGQESIYLARGYYVPFTQEFEIDKVKDLNKDCSNYGKYFINAIQWWGLVDPSLNMSGIKELYLKCKNMYYNDPLSYDEIKEIAKVPNSKAGEKQHIDGYLRDEIERAYIGCHDGETRTKLNKLLIKVLEIVETTNIQIQPEKREMIIAETYDKIKTALDNYLLINVDN